MQYTIEARELTSEYTHHDVRSLRTVVEADDESDAIHRYVLESSAELVSFATPPGAESIATVRTDDAVFLVRVYSD